MTDPATLAGGYLALLGGTIAAETLVIVPVALALATRLGKQPSTPTRTALDCCLLNLLTHPLAYLAITRLGAPFALAELTVVIAESLGYRALTGHRWRAATTLSLTANGITIALGLLLWS